MRNMTLENIAQASGGTYFGDAASAQVQVSSITTDSRKIQPGSLFIAIKGEKSDGHDFISQAYDKGSIAVISEKPLENETRPYILVSNSLEAIKKIAAFYRSQLSLTVIGITGSVGKTSTKEAVASVLSKEFKVLKTQGNFNNELGVPLTIFRLTEEDEVAVIEMGISDFGEMHRLSRIVKPDICIITNIGICHLENLKTRDGILRAKSEIFDYMNPLGRVILNGDDDMLSKISMVHGNVPDFFGMDESNDVWADRVESAGLAGTRCRIHTSNGAFDVTIPIPGKHMVTNALAASLVGTLMGLKNSQIKQGIEDLEPVNGRNNIIFGDKYTVIDDCYNANPVSMKSAIDVLGYSKTRKVAILGDMGELGENELQLHYEVGEYVGRSVVDLLVCAGEMSNKLMEGYLAARPDGECVHYDTVSDLLSDVENHLKTGDSCLVKASHFMKFGDIVQKLINQ
jgi:UDP-N-acetylmuramoyl-tripeptide--D-alanyl-D-alanine ligase